MTGDPLHSEGFTLHPWDAGWVTVVLDDPRTRRREGATPPRYQPGIGLRPQPCAEAIRRVARLTERG